MIVVKLYVSEAEKLVKIAKEEKLMLGIDE